MGARTRRSKIGTLACVAAERVSERFRHTRARPFLDIAPERQYPDVGHSCDTQCFEFSPSSPRPSASPAEASSDRLVDSAPRGTLRLCCAPHTIIRSPWFTDRGSLR